MLLLIPDSFKVSNRDFVENRCFISLFIIMKCSFVKVILPEWSVYLSHITQQIIQAYLVAPFEKKIDNTTTLYIQKVKHNLCAVKLTN